MEALITHIGGPTALIELGGRRLLTDPTFEPPGGRHRLRGALAAIASTKLTARPRPLGDHPPEAIRDRIRWLPIGAATAIAV